MSKRENGLSDITIETLSSDSYVQRTVSSLRAECDSTSGTVIDAQKGELEQISGVVNSNTETSGGTGTIINFMPSTATESISIGSGINLGDHTERGVVYNIADHRKRRLAQIRKLKNKAA